MYSFKDIKEKFVKLIAADCEPELEMRINGKYYMIIGYEGFITFQGNGSGEIRFDSLDELYNTETIDGICLARDWDKIEEMHAYEIEDMDTLLKIYELNKLCGERNDFNEREKKD